MCIESFNSWVPMNHRVATKFVNTSKAALYLRKGLRSHLNRKSEKYLKLTLTAESKIWIFRLAWTSYIYSSAFVALPLFLLLYHPQQFSLLQNIFLLFLRTGQGSHPFRKVQFFLTLFKRPLTPPLLFEHLSYFAGGVF